MELHRKNLFDSALRQISQHSVSLDLKFSPILWCSLSLRCRICAVDVLVMTGHLMISYSVHFDWL